MPACMFSVRPARRSQEETLRSSRGRSAAHQGSPCPAPHRARPGRAPRAGRCGFMAHGGAAHEPEAVQPGSCGHFCSVSQSLPPFRLLWLLHFPKAVAVMETTMSHHGRPLSPRPPGTARQRVTLSKCPFSPGRAPRELLTPTDAHFLPARVREARGRRGPLGVLLLSWTHSRRGLTTACLAERHGVAFSMPSGGLARPGWWRVDERGREGLEF